MAVFLSDTDDEYFEQLEADAAYEREWRQAVDTDPEPASNGVSEETWNNPAF